MLQIKIALGVCISNMITNETVSKIIKQLNKEDADRIEYRQLTKQIRVKEIPISQELEDMERMATIIKENPGILEFNVKQILKFSGRRYVICRQNVKSFYRGAITLGRISRVFNYQEAVIEKKVQEKIA